MGLLHTIMEDIDSRMCGVVQQDGEWNAYMSEISDLKMDDEVKKMLESDKIAEYFSLYSSCSVIESRLYYLQGLKDMLRLVKDLL